MSTLNVTSSTKGAAQVLGRNRASESSTRPARATHFDDAIAPDRTRRLAAPSSTVKKAKARRPTKSTKSPKSMREILDEGADIYSEFCKSRR